MGELRKIEVELDGKLTSFVDDLVASNRFLDASQVMRYAVTLLVEHERQDEEAWQDTLRTYGIDRLRAMIDEGLASGEPLEVTDDLFEDIKRRGRERLVQARAAE